MPFYMQIYDTYSTMFLLTVSLLALRLKLAQAFQNALPFRRLCLLFLGGFLFFPDLPLPCGKVTVVLLHNSLRLAVGCHERLHIGITVLFQNIGQFIQLFSDFLFCPLYLLCERLALLTLENPFCIGKLLFQFRKYRILQMPDFFRLILRLYHQLLHGTELCQIHAQEGKKAAREKAKAVVEELRSMKLKEAAKKVEDGIEETLTYCDFPSEHWTRIRTNNVIERLNREIRRRTRVVGSFPDGNSALMLVCARLRHVAGTQWGNKKYMNMKHLEAAIEDVSIAG